MEAYVLIQRKSAEIRKRQINNNNLGTHNNNNLAQSERGTTYIRLTLALKGNVDLW